MKINPKYFAIIGIILFLYIISRVGITKIVDVFYTINVMYLIPLLLMAPVAIILKGLKWNTVIKAHNLNYSLKDSCLVNIIGIAAGIITPTRLGDFVRVLYLNEKVKTFGRSISTVIVDRISDIVILLTIGFFGILSFTTWFGMQIISINVVLGFILVFICGIYILTKKSFIKVLLRPLFYKFIPTKYKSRINVSFHDFYDGLYTFRKNKLFIPKVLCLTVVIWFVGALELYVIALSLELDVSFLFIFFSSVLTMIVMLIPITVAGLGTREASWIFFLSFIGIPASKAIAFSLLAMLLTEWIYLFIGVFLWYRNPIKLS